ncbi:hypothetical protein Pmani_022144 [Petrolisthes manimaculis]|uniref:Alanyl-transfer RNA synthetases family profile domain-containing protein n=1 Tax=Petrolisthes manimaculis TaxID=1843537 RepID=A0AAE1PCP3_9EUCA|nr:hypothetical protein Pmani_022144 [Petrolisthes manimaculis]
MAYNDKEEENLALRRTNKITEEENIILKEDNKQLINQIRSLEDRMDNLKYTTKVVSCVPANIQLVVNGKKKKVDCYETIFEDTVFFPEGGGQPDDHGWVGEFSVLRVLRKGDVAVHYLDGPLDNNTTVLQQLDWTRRHNHMQQHSAQHLITAVADTMYGHETTSWYLGETLSHIELNTEEVTQEQMQNIEDKVNQYICASTPVTTEEYQATDPKLKEIRTRGLPEDVSGEVRVVSIEGVDANMCCGTHVSNLAQLQAVKLLYTERGKAKKTLLYFMAGSRLLRYLGDCISRERQLNTLLHTNPAEHTHLVQKLQLNLKQAQKSLKDGFRDLATLEAQRFLTQQPTPQIFTHHRKDGDLEYLGAIINEIDNEAVMKLLTCGEDKGIGTLILHGPPHLVAQVAPRVCEILDGRGGGKTRFTGKVKKVGKRTEAEKYIRSVLNTVVSQSVSQQGKSAVLSPVMALPAWRVRSFLGCVSVQRGAIIIAIIGVLESLVEASRAVLVLYGTELSFTQCHASARTVYQDNDDADKRKSICPSEQTVFMFRCLISIRIVVLFINVLLSALMMHGAKQKKPRLMAPWLWWQLSYIFLTVLAIFSIGSFSTIMFNLLLLTSHIYLFLVVNSCYLQFMEDNLRNGGVMVLAVARPHSEMHLTIPSPPHLKDDPPPPYPGPTSVTNMAYFPNDDFLPHAPSYAPPYSPYHTVGDTNMPPPPPYSNIAPNPQPPMAAVATTTTMAPQSGTPYQATAMAPQSGTPYQATAIAPQSGGTTYQSTATPQSTTIAPQSGGTPPYQTLAPSPQSGGGTNTPYQPVGHQRHQEPMENVDVVGGGGVDGGVVETSVDAPDEIGNDAQDESGNETAPLVNKQTHTLK